MPRPICPRFENRMAALPSPTVPIQNTANPYLARLHPHHLAQPTRGNRIPYTPLKPIRIEQLHRIAHIVIPRHPASAVVNLIHDKLPQRHHPLFFVQIPPAYRLFCHRLHRPPIPLPVCHQPWIHHICLTRILDHHIQIWLKHLIIRRHTRIRPRAIHLWPKGYSIRLIDIPTHLNLKRFCFLRQFDLFLTRSAGHLCFDGLHILQLVLLWMLLEVNGDIVISPPRCQTRRIHEPILSGNANFFKYTIRPIRAIDSHPPSVFARHLHGDAIDCCIQNFEYHLRSSPQSKRKIA